MYVEPTGAGLFNALFGQEANKWPQQSGITGMFGTDPSIHAKRAWDMQRLGYGTLPATEALLAGNMEARSRYLGDDPSSGKLGWSNRWDQWFGTDVYDEANDRLLMSPQHQTALRVGQDYGARDPRTGAPLTAGNNDITRGFGYTREALARNPYLDPTNQLAGFRGLAESSPYAMPNPGDYTAAMRAVGGPGDTDFYGQRGLGQTQGLAGGTDFDQYGTRGIDLTNALASANLRQLSRGIDREAEETLATDLPGIMQSFEAAGLGRSGAQGLNMMQHQGDVMAQANRDKQRTMADYTDREAARQAQAINLATQQGFAGEQDKYRSIAEMMGLQAQQGFGGEQEKFRALAEMMGLGSQIGAQGQEGFSNRMGEAALAGLGDQFRANEGYRNAEQALWQQGMDRQLQQYGMDTGNYLGAFTAGGQHALGALEQERLGQSQSLRDYTDLVMGREDWRGRALTEYRSLAEEERALRQERLNQQLASGMLPIEMMMQIATGTTGGSSAKYASTSPWASALTGIATGAGEGIGDWASGFLGPATSRLGEYLKVGG